MHKFVLIKKITHAFVKPLLKGARLKSIQNMPHLPAHGKFKFTVFAYTTNRSNGCKCMHL